MTGQSSESHRYSCRRFFVTYFYRDRSQEELYFSGTQMKLNALPKSVQKQSAIEIQGTVCFGAPGNVTLK